MEDVTVAGSIQSNIHTPRKDILLFCLHHQILILCQVRFASFHTFAMAKWRKSNNSCRWDGFAQVSSPSKLFLRLCGFEPSSECRRAVCTRWYQVVWDPSTQKYNLVFEWKVLWNKSRQWRESGVANILRDSAAVMQAEKKVQMVILNVESRAV